MMLKGCAISFGIGLWKMGKHVLCIVNFALFSDYGERHLKTRLHKRGLLMIQVVGQKSITSTADTKTVAANCLPYPSAGTA